MYSAFKVEILARFGIRLLLQRSFDEPMVGRGVS